MKKSVKFMASLVAAFSLSSVTTITPQGTQPTAYASTKKSGTASFNSKGNGTFKIKKATFKITAVKVMPSSEDGKSVMVFECDITNNSKKEFDLMDKMNPYEFIHASQRTSNANKSLDPGMVGLDDNADSLEKDRDDVMSNDSVLPGKTVKGDFSFTLVNDKKVKLKFSDGNYNNFATKSYKVTPQVTQ